MSSLSADSPIEIVSGYLTPVAFLPVVPAILRPQFVLLADYVAEQIRRCFRFPGLTASLQHISSRWREGLGYDPSLVVSPLAALAILRPQFGWSASCASWWIHRHFRFPVPLVGLQHA